MRLITTEAYQFMELDDRAKEKAREWWRHVDRHINIVSDADLVTTFCTVANFCGWSISTSRSSKAEPDVRYCYGPAPGDYVNWTGTWHANVVRLQELTDNYPKDEQLQNLCAAYAAIAMQWPDSVGTSDEGSRGSYAEIGWAGAAQIDDTRSKEYNMAYLHSVQLFRANTQLLQGWMLHQIEVESDYRQSSEYIDEILTINEYEFTKEGERL